MLQIYWNAEISLPIYIHKNYSGSFVSKPDVKVKDIIYNILHKVKIVLRFTRT